MLIIDSISKLRETASDWRQSGETIAFVPTMGNLHAGHLKLVEEARSKAGKVIVSLFVNPSQFCEGEDFEAYPRTPLEDEAKLRAMGTDCLFMPHRDEIYPKDCATTVWVQGLSEALCGQFRPGHFQGVTTIVCKLFNIVQPDLAFFGEKDFQQLTLIRQMAADLNMPIQIHGIPTVREPSGLALSSRNAYLSETEKLKASQIYRCLKAAEAFLLAGDSDYARIEAEQLQSLIQAGFLPDYFSIRNARNLGVPVPGEAELVVLTAAKLGKARLIDNLKIFRAE